MNEIITDAVRAAAMTMADICDVETVPVCEPVSHAGLIAPNAS